MGTHKSSSKKIQQGLQTKKRIMDCAAILFREKGYYQVTVDEVNACAKSSKGAFYTHFISKEELVVSMVSLIDEIYLGYLPADNQTALSKISSFIEFVFSAVEKRIGLDFISVIYSFQIRDPASPRVTLTPERSFYKICHEFIEEAKAKSEISPQLSTEHEIRILATGVRGAIYDWCWSRGQFELPQYGKEIIDRLLSSIKM